MSWAAYPVGQENNRLTPVSPRGALATAAEAPPGDSSVALSVQARPGGIGFVSFDFWLIEEDLYGSGSPNSGY